MASIDNANKKNDVYELFIKELLILTSFSFMFLKTVTDYTVESTSLVHPVFNSFLHFSLLTSANAFIDSDYLPFWRILRNRLESITKLVHSSSSNFEDSTVTQLPYVASKIWQIVKAALTFSIVTVVKIIWRKSNLIADSFQDEFHSKSPKG